VGKAVEQYTFELHEFANYSCKLRTGGTLIDFYQDLYDKLNDYLENTLKVATEAFETIAKNRKTIIEEISADMTDECCAFDAFSLSDPEVCEKLDKLVDDVPSDVLSRAFAHSGILEVDADDETALARAAAKVVERCFASFLSMSLNELCDLFGKKDVIRQSIEDCITNVSVATPVADDFALNRVICPKATKQDDIAGLRAEYKGMNYIWNGSVLNGAACVSQIKADVELEKFPGYEQWENLHYAYVNDSLKKHGIHIFK